MMDRKLVFIAISGVEKNFWMAKNQNSRNDTSFILKMRPIITNNYKYVECKTGLVLFLKHDLVSLADKCWLNIIKLINAAGRV